LARHRSPGGRQQFPVHDEAPEDALIRVRHFHRLSPPSSAVRGRVVVAAVAVGAFAAAAAGQTLQSSGQPADELLPLAGTSDASAAIGMGGDGSATPDVLGVARTSNGSLEAQKLAESERITQARAARAAEQQAQQEEASRPKYVKPTEGRFTSGFGARWGTTHYGVDIANRIGTPIVAVTDGVVVEAGSASGFGLWVRVLHDDGTISVYGHVDSFSVREGQKVKAGEQIARMGNRGHSTGPHLHFEIWDASGKKLNPVSWLAARGITL
jgi:murein DD-endopeptidase MepM/ murein hydrolase activator NlpD